MAGDRLERFIARWQGREGGQERANYALFLTDFADALGLPPPDPASATTEGNDYVLERAVREIGRDGSAVTRRIDLYRRSCFVLEAKQSRWRGGTKELPGEAGRPVLEPARGRRGAERAWDVLMLNARRQAEDYVRLLPHGHAPPPFVVVCDVGHCFELYANFRGDGKAYDQFPDRGGFRIYLEDLRRPEIRERLAKVWTDPHALDPSREAARATRAIAERLADVTRKLEAKGKDPDVVAHFLMRVLFTAFAQDVELIPRGSFSDLLEACEAAPETFAPLVSQLWEAMDKGQFAFGLKTRVRRFNGAFFRDHAALALDRKEIAELRAAAGHDWREVEPAIFGALLERALDPADRRKIGAHYTPRAYVERLVAATVIEPLRADWATALATAERQRGEGRVGQALKTVRAFHAGLCATRVLDPACGTGNFLYVTLEMMKRLEGEVLEALTDLGGQEALVGLEGHTVDPHRLLGLEKNPRAAAIAELVLWIGHLQWHARTRGGAPNEPILKAFRNVREADAALASEPEIVRGRGGRPETAADGSAKLRHRNPRRPEWPEAEFIVGNPPFLGGKDLRARLGAPYAEALWAAHPHMNESADFVMYWWDHAAELLARPGGALRRFGFVTTNSITQAFQRRVVERRLRGGTPLSIVMAIPDHPWTKAGRGAAAVRIAMTVVEAGRKDGVLREVTREADLDSDAPVVEVTEIRGPINPDLTVGADVGQARALRASEGMASPGVKLHGAGFIITEEQGHDLGVRRRPGLKDRLRPYRNGRDLNALPRRAKVIDLHGLAEEDVRRRFPEVYQHLCQTVRSDRERQHAKSPTADAEAYLRGWWLFGKSRPELRAALAGLPRYIATVETSKHRTFQFLDASILPDNMLVAIASDSAFHLGVLSSRVHVAWALAAGGWLGVGNDPRYSKTRCFDPFPFPDASPRQAAEIGALAEELDAHRKRVQAERPRLTLTAMYNVLERLNAGVRPASLTAAERRVFDEGLILILKELQDRLDRATAAAYGWPERLSAPDIVARLVVLNAARAAEEKRGAVRWLRPAFQAPRFGRIEDRRQRSNAARIEAPLVPRAATARKLSFPKDDAAQTASVLLALLEARKPIEVAEVAARFRGGRRTEEQVGATLAALARLGAVSGAGAGPYALRSDALSGSP